MRAAQLKDNVVINYAEVEAFNDEFIDPLDSVLGSTWNGATFTAPEPVITSTVFPRVTPFQLRRALNEANLRDEVEAVIDSADQDTKDGWEYATYYERDNPLLLALVPALGVTTEEIDEIFLRAAEFN